MLTLKVACINSVYTVLGTALTLCRQGYFMKTEYCYLTDCNYNAACNLN